MKNTFFQISENYNYQICLKLMSISILLIVPSSVVGVAILNLFLIFFDFLFLIFLIMNLKFFSINRNQKIILLFSLIYLSLNIFFSEDINLTFYRSLNLLKMIIFIFGFIFLFKSNKKLDIYFLTSVFITVVFVALDTYY